MSKNKPFSGPKRRRLELVKKVAKSLLTFVESGCLSVRELRWCTSKQKNHVFASGYVGIRAASVSVDDVLLMCVAYSWSTGHSAYATQVTQTLARKTSSPYVEEHRNVMGQTFGIFSLWTGKNKAKIGNQLDTSQQEQQNQYLWRPFLRTFEGLSERRTTGIDRFRRKRRNWRRLKMKSTKWSRSNGALWTQQTGSHEVLM